MPEYPDIVKKAQAILGEEAKIPQKLSPPVLQALKEEAASYQKFDSGRDALEKLVLAMQKAEAGLLLSVKQFAEQLQKSSFEMDKNAADYKKKRADAQKLFDDFFDDKLKGIGKIIKDADELDKHLMKISDYESPK